MKCYFKCENKIPFLFPEHTVAINPPTILFYITWCWPSRAKYIVININADNEIILLWSTVSSGMLHVYGTKVNRFGGTYCFHLQGKIHGVTFQKSVTLAKLWKKPNCYAHSTNTLCSRPATPAPEFGSASDPTSEVIRRPGEANGSPPTRAVQQRLSWRHSRQPNLVHARYTPLPPRRACVHGHSLCCIRYMNYIYVKYNFMNSESYVEWI